MISVTDKCIPLYRFINKINDDLFTVYLKGKGKFGDVFLAKARAIRPPEPETLVVVKSLLTKGEVVSAEFHAEMDMYSKMEHSNVVRLLGVCREAEPFFMITEYCDWVGSRSWICLVWFVLLFLLFILKLPPIVECSLQNKICCAIFFFYINLLYLHLWA